MGVHLRECDNFECHRPLRYVRRQTRAVLGINIGVHLDLSIVSDFFIEAFRCSKVIPITVNNKKHYQKLIEKSSPKHLWHVTSGGSLASISAEAGST